MIVLRAIDDLNSLFEVYLTKIFLKTGKWKCNFVSWINVSKEGSLLFRLCGGTESRFFWQLWTLNISSFQGSQSYSYPRCSSDTDVSFRRHLSCRATTPDLSVKTSLSDNSSIQTKLICTNVCVCVWSLRSAVLCSHPLLLPSKHRRL